MTVVVGVLQIDDMGKKSSFASWWKQLRVKKSDDNKLFGLSLTRALEVSKVAIFLTRRDGEKVFYGYIPAVVAKCGFFLKQNATQVKGIFRVNGSSKRIQILQKAFSTGPDYGRSFDWEGYTVHDAANVFRRFINLMPEHVIPLEYYERFREPMTIPNLTDNERVEMYRRRIDELPIPNRQLLLYLLDLLSVFAMNSSKNLMTADNLAAIFQPGILSHPDHEVYSKDYQISQTALLFLINHQGSFIKTIPLSSLPPLVAAPTSPNTSSTLITQSAAPTPIASTSIRINSFNPRNGSIKRWRSFSRHSSATYSNSPSSNFSNMKSSEVDPGSPPRIKSRSYSLSRSSSMKLFHTLDRRRENRM
ncbi:Rho-type GTPase activating protein Rga5 [Schizosaccharomyces pombe]|uniref:Rho-GTPase-activating protein 5 n=1 Tax=Schizosaccharomyces pombe (strain 972 / ATCC 24843) TaxID=284812 RepID=RGA5_SCHPO|nr:Rho-type GTPase-activating protein Rga5 [Schizosaccharomyces pombe]O74335.2 RecName: Full=Rho-GTPase-activating protein 5 [Schizosaccharomyces pombe 972h-]CAA20323.2 Rho-type GTPase activating protein Rga5 [Schizosaccharomyces pombe]|eukprot:NP_596024.2 Rho-type GTPase-activating protein Rga5 [Schizosaccharomyces pombe]